MATKYFNLLLVAVVMNLTPLTSVILGILILKETMKWKEHALLLVSIVSVMMIICGG